MKKIKTFFKGIKKEAKAVRWSDAKTLIKYSCITILMLIFVGLFFYGLDAIFSAVRRLF
jgi:preprotein translocase SecE subunit